MNTINNHVYSIIVKQINEAQNKLEYIIKHYDMCNVNDIVYALGNINAFIVVRDLINPSTELTAQDYRQINLQKRIRQIYKNTGWIKCINDTIETYNNI